MLKGKEAICMSCTPGVTIYGDSILKATVPDEELRYHFHFQQFLKRFESLPVTLTNRARFGATVEKGSQILTADLARGLDCRVALLEFGGNDSNFDWPAIAADPAGQHLPATSLDVFSKKLGEMADTLLAHGVTPVLMELPPIDAQRYFDFFSRGLNRANLLSWLHGDVQRIYRFQEMYSNAVVHLARVKNLKCLDLRSRFLGDADFEKLISADGIHLTDTGYDVLFDALKAELCRWLAEQPDIASA